MPSEDKNDHMTQHQPMHTNSKSTANSSANPTLSITSEFANVTNAFKEKKKLVRRAFSMPRNLFRLSRRVKSTSSSTAAKTPSADVNTSSTPSSNSNSCSQAVQTNSDGENKLNMENVANGTSRTLPVSSSSTEISNVEQKQQQQHLPEAKTQPEPDNKHRLFRRSTWKKFLFSRFILQSINLKVIFVRSFHQSNVMWANLIAWGLRFCFFHWFKFLQCFFSCIFSLRELGMILTSDNFDQ